MFKQLQLHDWRQFQSIEIDFHDRLTILTGANGSGKSTILNLLIKHFGWNKSFASTPKKDSRGMLGFIVDYWHQLTSDLSKNEFEIGKFTYSDGNSSPIRLPRNVTQQYEPIVPNAQTFRGLHIPSHRYIYTYQSITQIPTSPPTRDKIYSSYSAQIKNFYIGGGAGQSPSFYIKQDLISLVIFGYGNEHVKPNLDAKETFEGFQEILRTVLPPKLGFNKITVDVPEVTLETKTGSFSLDSVSGGVAAIIDLAWQVYMYSNPKDRFVVTIDEPENHLHPELQRTLLPNFIKAFPNAQFIIATHNPFIVSSVPESNVYVLDYNSDQRVESTHLDMVNKAGSSNDILRDVLGLPTTMPIWVEDKLNSIIDKYSQLEFTADNLKLLREEMKEIGLEKVIPETISHVSERTAHD